VPSSDPLNLFPRRVLASKLAFHYLLRSTSSHKGLVYLGIAGPTEGMNIAPIQSAVRHGVTGLHRSFLPSTTKDILIRTVSPVAGESCSTSAVPFPVIPNHRREVNGAVSTSDTLIANTIFHAATDPSRTSHGVIYTVPTASSSSQFIARMTSRDVDINSVGIYLTLATKFYWILL
jgi:hypothetical protein